MWDCSRRAAGWKQLNQGHENIIRQKSYGDFYIQHPQCRDCHECPLRSVDTKPIKKVNIGMSPMVSNNGVQGCPRHKKSLRWERRIWKQKTHLMQNVYFCVFQWGPFQIYKEVDKCDVVLRCSVEPRLPVFKLQNYFALYSTDRTRLSPGRRHARIEVNNHHFSCKAAEMPHINTHY